MARKAVVIGETDYYIAERIQLRRTMLGMSQSDLAERCGVSFQQIQKYESANNRISASRLFDISTALNTPIEFFFSEICDKKIEQQKNDPLSKNESLKLLNLFWKLPDEKQRKMILKMLKALNAEL